MVIYVKNYLSGLGEREQFVGVALNLLFSPYPSVLFPSLTKLQFKGRVPNLLKEMNIYCISIRDLIGKVSLKKSLQFKGDCEV